MTSTLSTFAWIGMSILVSELLGYALHRLMHSGKIEFLSRSHMRHHLLLYGPLQPQRSGSEYRDATVGKIAIGNIGLEWLAPGAAILVSEVLALRWLKVEFFHQAIFIAVSLAWSFLMFSYLHDRMHVTGFWMERNRWLKSWFLSARRAHDIHHWALNPHGFMDKNFGIGFFFFDRCFGTFTAVWPVFNRLGYEAAKQRFGGLLSQDGQIRRDFVGQERLPSTGATSGAHDRRADRSSIHRRLRTAELRQARPCMQFEVRTACRKTKMPDLAIEKPAASPRRVLGAGVVSFLFRTRTGSVCAGSSQPNRSSRCRTGSGYPVQEP
jgi:hypothetical protein